MSNKIYFINYDETSFESEIKEKIKSLGPWFSYFGRSWLVESNLSAQEIHNKLFNETSKFQILVLEIKISSYWGWMPKEAWTWLAERTPKNTP